MIERSPDSTTLIRPSVNRTDTGGPHGEEGPSAPSGRIQAKKGTKGVSVYDEVNNADEETFEIPEEIVEEETEDLRVAPSPLMPTSSEVEEHRITHYRYRS